MTNKFLLKFLIYSTVTLTGTRGGGIGISLSGWEQISVAQEIESSFSDSRINGRLDSNSATLEDGSYFNDHTFEGKAGETLTLELISDEFDAYLMLYDPDDNKIGENDDRGQDYNATIIVTLSKTGIYTITVSTAKARESGNYVLNRREATEKDIALAEAERLNKQADELYQQGKYKEAIPLEKKVLVIIKEQLGDNHPNTVSTLNDLARLYKLQGKYSEAKPLYLEALSIIIEELDDNYNYYNHTATLNNLAELHKLQGRYSEAEPLYLEALSIITERSDDNDSDTATILNNLAGLYRLQGRYAEAEPLYLEALAIIGDTHSLTAGIFNNVAALYESQGRYAKAERLLQQAVDITKEQKGELHPDTANRLNNLAEIYRLQGRYAEAEPLYLEALAIRKKQLGDNHPDTANSLNNLALLYDSQGRYSETEPFYLEALAIRKKQLGDNHPDTANSLNNLAGLYRLQGRYAEAEPLYLEALAIRKKQLGDNHSDIATSLNDLAGLFSSQGGYSEAETLLQQALVIRKKQLGDNHPDIAINLNDLAFVYSRQGKYTEAEPLYQQALEIYREELGKNHPFISISLNTMGTIYQSLGNISDAIDYLRQGIEVEEYNLSENLIAGSERQKRDYIATILGTTDGVISLNFKSAPKNPDATNLALTTVLQRKGRILDVLTNSLQILRQQTNDPTTQDLLTDYYNLRNQYSNLVFRKPEDIKSPKIHSQQLNELETQTKQLEDQLSRRSAEFRKLSEPVTLEKIKQLIPQNSALVELVRYQPFNPQAPINNGWGKPRYAAYIIHSKGNPQAIDLGEAEPIDKAIEQFRRNLCTQTKTSQATQFCLDNLPIAQVKSSAHKLDKMVMEPVRQLLGETKNILLSPDSKLNLVPFEALVDENNRYLVENYNFTYLTSGRDLMRLRDKSPSDSMPLVMADPLYSGDTNLVASNRSIENISQLFNKLSFARLPETEEEAKAIQSQLKLSDEQIKLQDQARESILKQLESPEILHIATHGFFIDKPVSETTLKQESPFASNLEQPVTIDNPLFRSGLVLAEENFSTDKKQEVDQSEELNDGVLTAYETTLLDLTGTKLVVLSACDTGVGDVSTGEGIYGLRRALVIAGSESQLISLWKVVDEGTKDLMTAYYEKLQQGEGRTNALHKVQRQMLRGELKGEKGQSYEHPYYWASFIPSGDWTPIKSNQSP